MASVILNCVYDYDPRPEKDELVDIVARVLEIVVPAFSPGVAIVVGVFPACEWFVLLSCYTDLLLHS